MLHRSFWLGAMEHEWPFWDSPRWDYDWWLRIHSSVRTESALIPETPSIHHISRHGLNVRGPAANLYLGMPLATGQVLVSPDSISVAGDEVKTRELIMSRIVSATLVSRDVIDKALIDHRGGSLLIHFNDDEVSIDEMPFTAPHALKRLFEKFSL